MNNIHGAHHPFQENDMLSNNGIPLFGRNGTALSNEERATIAKKRGLCVRCGIKTHGGNILRKTPVNNQDVHHGTCIRCNPEAVPPPVLAEWQSRMSSTIANSNAAANNSTNAGRLRGVVRAVNYANQAMGRHAAPASHRSNANANGSMSMGGASSISSMSNSQSNMNTSNYQHANSLNNASASSNLNNGSNSGHNRYNPPRRTASAPADQDNSNLQHLLHPPTSPSPSRMMANVSVGSPKLTSNAAASADLNAALRVSRDHPNFTRTASSPPAVNNGLSKSMNSAHLPGDTTTNNANSIAGMRSMSTNNVTSAANDFGGSTSDADDALLIANAAQHYQHHQQQQPPNLHPSVANSPYSNSNRKRTVNVNINSSLTSSLNSSTSTTGSIRNLSSSINLSENNSSRIHRSNLPSLQDSISAIQSNYSNVSSSGGPIEPQSYKSSTTEDSWSLVKGLKDHRDDPNLLQQKLHGLRNLGDDQASALYEVKDIMQQHSANYAVLKCSAGAIWGISAKSDDKRAEAIETGVVECVLSSLNNANASADYTAWALGSLASVASSPENLAYIAKQGGMETILQVLQQHSKAASVFEWACRAIFLMITLSDGNSDAADDAQQYQHQIQQNITTIEENNGIQIILAAMRNHTTEPWAEFYALKVLWRVLDRPELLERVTSRLIEDDCIAVCFRIIKNRSTPPECFQYAAELLCQLSLFATQYYLGSMAPDCVSTCIRILQENGGDIDLQSTIFRLLTTLSRRNNHCKSQISNNGIQLIVNAIVDACRATDVDDQGAFSELLLLLCNGFMLLSMLSSEPGSFDHSIVGQLKPAFVVIDKSDDADLSNSLCYFVANVSLHLTNPNDIPMDTIKRLASCGGDGQEQEAGVSEPSVRALSALCSRFPDFANTLANDDVLAQRLARSIADPNVSIQASCCIVLNSLCSKPESLKQKLMAKGIMQDAANALETSKSESVSRSILELISSFVLNDGEQYDVAAMAMRFPDNLVDAIQKTIQQFATSSTVACTALRNVLLMAAPGALNMDSQFLSESLTDIVNNQANTVESRVAALGAIWALTAKHPDQPGEVLGELFQAVITIMGQHRGEGAPFNSPIQCAGSGALSSVIQAIRGNPIQISDNDIDLIMCILDFVIECDVQNAELIAAFLDVILSLSVLHRELVVQFGVIVLVIDCMVEHEQHELIQDKGCAILALLASTENLQVNLSIAETDGIDMIVSALAIFSHNLDIQLNACRALSHLSIDHESRMLISSQGGIILLVNAMNSFADNVDLLESSCSALLNLSSDAEEQVLAGSNMVEVVINIMRTKPNSPVLQEKVLGVLQNVSMRSRDAKRAIAEAGGIDAVMFAIREFMGSPAVLERAFTTMWSLGVLEANQAQIAESGGIDLLVNGMMANISYEKVQKQACGCLCTLSSNSRNKTLIREVGGIHSIVYAMWAHYASEALQIEACRALSSLAVNIQTNEVMVASEGEIQAIITAMKRFPHSERLQEHACVALRNFTLSVDNIELVRQSADEVKTLMKNASSRFPDRCAERARQVLAGLG